MGLKSRTPAKANGQAKTKSKSRSKDQVAFSRAIAILSEKKMRPELALRRAGVTSAAAVKRLTKALKDRELKDASRLEKKAKTQAATARLKASRRQKAKGDNNPARNVAARQRQNEEQLTHTLAPALQDANRLPVSQELMSFADPGVREAPRASDLVSAFNGLQMNFWTTMFHFSPLGVMLRQTAAVGRLLTRADPSGRSLP